MGWFSTERVLKTEIICKEKKGIFSIIISGLKEFKETSATSLADHKLKEQRFTDHT